MTSGLLSETGNPLDLAISGDGFFELRGEGGSLYTRNGQFTRAEDGRLLGIGDLALQAVGGGDLVVPVTGYKVTADGSVMDGDRTVARIAIASFDAGAATSGQDGLLLVEAGSTRRVDAPLVRQGFLESSNVSLGDEMIALMEAVRRAETGQRLINVYDDLLGRAITTFGQAN